MDEELKMFKNDFLLAEIILCGVFNAKIGKDCENDNLHESSQSPNNDFFNYTAPVHGTRNSKDTVVNGRGRQLIQL